MRTFVVRAIAVWIVATLAAVGFAVEAFDLVAEDVRVRRDAPISRREVGRRLQERVRATTGSTPDEGTGRRGTPVTASTSTTDPSPPGPSGGTTRSTARIGPDGERGGQTSTTDGTPSTTLERQPRTDGAGSIDNGGNGAGNGDTPARGSR